MREKGFVLTLVLLGVAVIVTIIGALAYFEVKSKPPPTQNSFSQTQTTLPPNIDETANWKSYTNSDFGYQIRYPENLALYEFKEIETVYGVQKTRSPEFKSPRGEEVEIGSLKLPREDKKNLEKIISEVSPSFLIKDKLPLTFLGLPALRLEFEVEAKGGEGSFIVYGSMLAFEKDDTLFQIILFTAPPSSPLREESLKTFDQMLSTFKFLD